MVIFLVESVSEIPIERLGASIALLGGQLEGAGAIGLGESGGVVHQGPSHPKAPGVGRHEEVIEEPHTGGPHAGEHGE